MNPARRGIESVMRATRSSERATRRAVRARKTAPRRPVKSTGKTASKLVAPPQVMLRLCKTGWAVIVEKIPNAQGTRFVCPFCPLSHRVSGPVRGFRKLRRAQWVKLRRVEE
jgi:hypothetical protein